MKSNQLVRSKRSQVAIFVIIAIVIIGGLVAYFVLKDRAFQPEIPASLEPVYDYYISCLENDIKSGSQIMASQGGYLELPDFEPGSTYSPFSSQLDFLGSPVQYWYYISANGVVKERIPSINNMQQELDSYVEEEVGNCDFEGFRERGYSVDIQEAEVDTEIKENEISAVVSQRINMSYQDTSIVVNTHRIKVRSKIGEYYELAKKIYDYEQDEMFLENYAVDVMYLYAPVSGVEISCSPKVWGAQEVVDNIKEGLEANIGFIKVKGDYYQLSNEEHKYYVVDIGEDVDTYVSFMYNRDWPTRIEVWPADEGVMMAEPVGPDFGGIMGLCYVPYKFAYDIYFPVMMQIVDNNGEEVFNVPMAIVVNKNKPREALTAPEFDEGVNICDNANAEISVYTYNNNLDPVEADIEFQCIDSRCSLGSTNISGEDAVLDTLVPACINGIISAKADGYAEKEVIVSTNDESTVDILLDREYNLDLEVYVDGNLVTNPSVVRFENNGLSSIVYPQQNNLSLGEGWYNISAYIMSAAQVTIPASTQTQCTMVREGLAGLFGFEKEQCFDVTIPAQTLEQGLYAGGSTSFYAVESELETSSRIKIYTTSFPQPNSLDQLQKNYELYENARINVELI